MNALNWKAWLAAIVLFLAGMATGSVLTVGHGARVFRAAFLAPPPAGPHENPSRLQRHLVRELDLTEAQSAQVKTELEQMKTELKRIRFSSVQRARNILHETMARIAADLPADKREKFKSLSKERLRHVGLDDDAQPGK